MYEMGTRTKFNDPEVSCARAPRLSKHLDDTHSDRASPRLAATRLAATPDEMSTVYFGRMDAAWLYPQNLLQWTDSIQERDPLETLENVEVRCAGLNPTLGPTCRGVALLAALPSMHAHLPTDISLHIAHVS